MLPTTERLLLGPGPSPVSDRVQAALAAPPRSHLDPELVRLLDDVRARLARTFRAPAGALVLATSGTGTSAMETAVANLAQPGIRALAVVNGYFGDRLAGMLSRYGATVDRLDLEWGRAADPEAVERALDRAAYDVVSIVHGETSTGVRNPVADITRAARARQDVLVIADTVTTLGAVPVDMSAWEVDVCYACSQKGLGAPSGLSPIALSPRALERLVPCRSFYLDIRLIEDFWVRRKYHHTISAPLVYALDVALEEVEDEGLELRWDRHARVHRQFVDALAGIGLSLFPPEADRLWSLNAVSVPEAMNEGAVRVHLLQHHGIEIGAGLGPLAGKIWRVGLMGSGAIPANVDRLMQALPGALTAGRTKGGPQG
jgi:alanine-glyoxylate transaminase/serine-glyoxylate transaminase/serine-pyruvate transaminase